MLNHFEAHVLLPENLKLAKQIIIIVFFFYKVSQNCIPENLEVFCEKKNSLFTFNMYFVLQSQR